MRVAWVVPCVVVGCMTGDDGGSTSDTGLDSSTTDSLAVDTSVGETVADSASPDASTEATGDGGVTCPSPAGSCAPGKCVVVDAAPIDRTKKCLMPHVSLGACATGGPIGDGGCLGSLVCVARTDTAQTYWLSAICYIGDLVAPWRACTSSEQAEVSAGGPACP